jgi:hypothetical protein
VAGEVDLDLVDAGEFLEGLADGLFALVAVHPLDSDQCQVIATNVLGHAWGLLLTLPVQ